MNETIVRLLRGKLAPAVCSILFGVALIIARRSAMDVLVRATAVIIAVGGLAGVLQYFFGPVKDRMQLSLSVFALAFGVLCWFIAGTLVDIFPILAGIMLILNGLSNLAPLSSPADSAGTPLVVLFSILMIGGGLFIVFHPAAAENMLMVYIGVCYILNGIFDLILLHRMKEILLPGDKE